MNGYENHALNALLSGNPYPGRGIVLGQTADGSQNVAAYFIMGRSENSRNRIFVKEPDGIRTQAHDPAKLEDPSLIIYHPVRQFGRGLVVTNGDQTDTIRDFLEQGLPFEQALRTREFEPDGPNWTPRISGLLSPDGSYKLSILKSADAQGSGCARYTFEYPGLPGVGHFLHTYVTDGNPIPTFQGEPERVAIQGTLEEFAGMIWDNLNEANKISLYVRFTDRATGDYREIIRNKHLEAGEKNT
ncbi:MAG: inosine monophosphate cyclohydrolase [Ruminiclostridium sp.]|nr:inosine monophosphate cyclohydrolase [Ruminiclostridium sp.]